MEIAFGSHPDDVYHVDEVGYLQLGQQPAAELEAGEVGYVVASLRERARRSRGRHRSSTRTTARRSCSRDTAT